MKHGPEGKKENPETLAGIGVAVEKAHLPLLLGGDVNMTPAELEQTGFAEMLGARIVVLNAPRGTYKCGRNRAIIDMFVVDCALCDGIEKTEADYSEAPNPHWQVKLEFFPKLSVTKALAFVEPAALPKERIFGPIKPLPPWGLQERAVLDAKRAIEQGASKQQVQDKLDRAYKFFADNAEKELEKVTGTFLTRRGDERKKLKAVLEGGGKAQDSARQPNPVSSKWLCCKMAGRSFQRFEGCSGGAWKC